MPYPMPKVLIVDDVHALLTEGLAEKGFEVHYRPDIAAAEVAELIVDMGIQGLVVRSKMRLDAEFFQRVQGILAWVGRAGAGLDNLDLDAAEVCGVFCFNSGEANSVAVGEHTLGMLLSLLRNLGKGNLEVRRGLWDREGNRGVELQGLVVGVLGFGNTGSAVCNRLMGFGCSVIAVDKYKKGFAPAFDVDLLRAKQRNREGVIFEGSLEDLFTYSDVLTLHVPLSSETRNWMNMSQLDKFAKPFWLLNLSRGEVVETKSVLQGLRTGKILGFAADVLEVEPPFHGLPEWEELMEFSNVIFSPHVGGWTVESYRKISEVLLAKVLDYCGLE